MTRPVVRAQVAFDTNPLDTPSWTTIHDGTTRRVLSASTRHGRQFELDAFQPGQMTLDLENSDRRFDPLHAAGPYFGDLLPRKRCRLQADWGAYLNLTGSEVSGAWAPDVAALDIVGDIDIRARCGPVDWTPLENQVIVAKATTTGNWSYALGLTTGGNLQIGWSPTGATAALITVDSTVPVGADDGAIRWVRATLDVDDGGGNRVVRFYVSDDETHDHSAVDWVQLGSAVTTAGTTSIFSGTAVLTVGVLATGLAPMHGRVYAAAVLDGIGGTVVADPDFTDGNRFAAGASTGTDPAGRLWTVSAPASLVAVTYDLFSGFVDSWPQTFGRFQAAAQMSATDGFKVLSRVDLSGAHEETVRADGPTGWWRLGDNPAVSTVCADSSGNGLDGVFVNDPTSADSIVDGTNDGAISFDGVNDKLDLPAAAAPTTLPFTIEFWVTTSQTVAGTPGAVVFAATWPFGFDPGWVDTASVYLTTTGALKFTATTGVSNTIATSGAVNDGLKHHVACTVAATERTARIYIDGALADTGAASASDAMNTADRIRVAAPRSGTVGYEKFAGTLDEFAIYNRALSADEVAAHAAAGAAPWAGDTTGERIDRALTLAGWPTADRDIDTGRSTMGAYEGLDQNTLAVVQEAEATEGGVLWQAPDGTITFRDRHAPIQDWNATTSQAAFTDDGTADDPQHYTAVEFGYDDDLIINEAQVDWADGSEVSRDQASIDAFTRSSTQVTTALRTAPEARDRGDWLLARFANPSVRPDRVVLRPAADDRLWRHCLARRIGDRVTVRRLPQGVGTAIEFDATIESINHRIADGLNTWETEFGLSPSTLDLGWLILDDSAAGVLGVGKLAF